MQSVQVFNRIAPFFRLPSINPVGWLSFFDFSNRNLILFFLPDKLHQDTLAQIKMFQERLPEFSLQDTDLLAIFPLPVDALTRLAEETDLDFRLLSDVKGELTSTFSNLDEDVQSPPFIALIDATGHVHRIYSSKQYPHLPNPAILVRAVRNLNVVPKPAQITSDDWSTGPADAAVTLVEYSDYQCKSCMKLHEVLQDLLACYPGNIRLVHRHLPMRSSHPLAQIAAEAAEAAGDKGKFWEMNHRLFQANGELEIQKLSAYAKEIGLDAQSFEENLENRRFKPAVDEDFKAAIGRQIKLPPTLFINEVIYQGPISQERLSSAIDSILQSASSPKETGNQEYETIF